MKKVKIILTLLFIIVGMVAFKLFYTSTSNNGSIKYNIMIGSTKSATFPNTSNYTVNVTCTSGKGTVVWNPKLATPTWEFKFENGYTNNNGTYTRSNITSNDFCDIVFTARTSSNKLNTHIKSLLNGNAQVNSGSNGILKNEGTTAGELIPLVVLNNNMTWISLNNQADYTVASSNSYISFTDGKWVHNYNNTNAQYISFTIQDTAYYQMCYTHTGTSSTYSLILYNPGYTGTSTSTDYILKTSSAVTSEQCTEYGFIESGTTIKIRTRIQSGNQSTFYLRKSTDYTTTDYYHDRGIRYVGANPDNYIMFNNELWRIIGVFREAKTSPMNGSETYYTKIIRNESIGGYAYNSVSNGGWWSKSDGSESILNYLLNHYYIGADNDDYNGTSDTDHCRIYSTSVTRNCDYRVIGIQPGWRDMIINSTWYTAAGVNSTTASTLFSGERGSTAGKAGGELSYTGKVGLMYPSDYLYSGSSASSRWLLQYGHEWTISPSSFETSKTWIVSNDGTLYTAGTQYGYVARPTVYLSDSVYITGGDGSLLNPYTIAM